MEWMIEGLTKVLVSSSFRYFILAGIPFAIFYVIFQKRFQKNKIQSRHAKHNRFLSEIMHSLPTMVILAISGAIVFFSPFRAYTQIYTDLSAYPLWWVPLSILLSLVIHDTYFYWMHLAIHQKALFRSVHRIHHLSVNPSPWAAYSFDVLEAILEQMIIYILVLLLPLHPVAIFIFSLISFTVNVYGHLGYEIAPRWFRTSFLFEILNSSVYHNLHHKKFHGNYGLYFRIWDKLMGTENPNYVKIYDEIQVRRFGDKAFKHPSFAFKNFLLIIFSISVLAFTTKPELEPDITGIWEATGLKGKGTVEIYQDDNMKVSGRFLEASGERNQEKVQQAMSERSIEEITVLSDFEYAGDSIWQNGYITWMEKGLKLNGQLILLSENKLKVIAKWKGFEKTFIWRKSQD